MKKIWLRDNHWVVRSCYTAHKLLHRIEIRVTENRQFLKARGQKERENIDEISQKVEQQ